MSDSTTQYSLFHPDRLSPGFKLSYINTQLMVEILKGIDPDASLISWNETPLDTSNSILSQFSQSDEDIHTFVGHISFRIQYRLPNGSISETDVVLKSKPIGQELLNVLLHHSKNGGVTYEQAWHKFIDTLEFTNTDFKELEAFQLNDPSITSIRPNSYFTWEDSQNHIFIYVTENFHSSGYTHLDKVNDIAAWKSEDIEQALYGIAGMHARYYNKVSDLPSSFIKYLGPAPTTKSMIEKISFWQAALEFNSSAFPEIWTSKHAGLLSNILDHLEDICSILYAAPVTLIHNDFNVRNSCMRAKPKNGQKKLCLYDWELLQIGPPQHDVAEFLVFVLPEDTDITTWQKYIRKYREYFINELKCSTEDIHNIEKYLLVESFQRIFDMAVMELLINRLALIGLSNIIKQFQFLPRVINCATNYVRAVSKNYKFLNNNDISNNS